MKRTNTILTLSNGRHVDLRNPRASDIDFAAMAEHLAKENRFNGATPNLVYSVGEHSIRAASEALQETGDEELAAYLLMHDGHEFLLKDDTTPKKHALEVEAQESFGVLAGAITGTYDRLTFRIDAAIHEAAGLIWPPSPEMKAAIKHWDRRMFVTEWRDLMRGIPHPDPEAYRGVELLETVIFPWHWPQVREQFLDYCKLWLPSMKGGR